MPHLSDVACEIERAAVISKCGAYRYSLTRIWSDAPLLPFVMLNPSTADAKEDDPTIRRCIGFARREGAGGLIVANLYALRAPAPEALWSARDPIGPKNRRTLIGLAAQAVAQSLPIICAWGTLARKDQSDEAVRMFHASGARLACLGRTQHGAPRHPLYVRADQPLERFP